MAAITRDLLRILSADINAALKEVGDRHGVVIKTGNASFNDTIFTYKLEGSLKGGPTKLESDYNSYRAIYELPALHSTTIFAGKPYKICGWKGRSVIIEDSKGKQYRIKPEQMQK